jgi:hypothetical protein
MATRDDITVSQYLSPRVAEVAQPSNEVVMQDYVDTLRTEEEAFRSMSFSKLINASGKEDLGGGVLVGITVSEQNVQLAFEPNVTPVHIGTVTTASGPPSAVGRMQFTDSTADFIADGVQPGSFIINFTDNSVVDVVRIISTDTLETRTLANGSNNEFDFGDVIHVFNIRQCKTTGGNLVAVDDNDVAIPAILPTAFTQVVLTTSSSATIQELGEVRYAAYQNAVWYQDGSGNAGTDYPNGTPTAPLNNFQDVRTVADSLGFEDIKINGNATLTTGDDLAGFNLIGRSEQKTTITINGAANVLNSTYEDCTLTGVLDGVSAAKRCLLTAVSDVNGEFTNCGITGSLTLATGGYVGLINCHSESAGAGVTPIIIIGDASLYGRDYSGGVEFQSKTGAGDVSWDFDSGQAIVNNNCTTGTMTLRGTAFWTNKSTYAGSTVVNDKLDNTDNTVDAVWNALIADYSVTGSFGEFIVRRLLTVAKFFALR